MHKASQKNENAQIYDINEEDSATSLQNSYFQLDFSLTNEAPGHAG